MYIVKINQLRHLIDQSLKAWQWWALAIASFAVCRFTMTWLGGLYQASLFPVSIFEGQTTFNGDLVKSYYAVLLENGTLGKYIGVQLLDFLLMLTMFAALACMTIAAYRSVPDNKIIKNIAWFIVIAAPLAPFFDALENFVSFFMLADPLHFPNWLAMPYSTFAVTKFALSGLGFMWTPLAGFISLLWFAFACVQRCYISLVSTKELHL